jgi:hypothetical protein
MQQETGIWKCVICCALYCTSYIVNVQYEPLEDVEAILTDAIFESDMFCKMQQLGYNSSNNRISASAYTRNLVETGTDNMTGSRINERTITMRFLGIILRVLRLEVSVWFS